MDHYPLNTKFLKNKFQSKNLEMFWEFSESFTFSRSLILPQQTKEFATCTKCPMANRVNPDNFFTKMSVKRITSEECSRNVRSAQCDTKEVRS